MSSASVAAPKRRFASPSRPSSSSTRVEPARLGLERRQERAERGRRLPQPRRGVGKLGRRRGELLVQGRSGPERLLRLRGEVGGAVAVLGRQRLRGGIRRLGQARGVAQPVAFAAKRLLGVRREAFSGVREGLELCYVGLPVTELLRELVTAPTRFPEGPPGGGELAPAPQLLLAGERVEELELVGGLCEPALLELTRHRDQTLDQRGELLARHRAAPGVRAAATVAEDAPGRDEARLVRRAQLGERGELLLLERALGQVELGLDVGLLAGRAHEGRIPLGAQQEADRLGEDRLAGAGLPGDRGEAGAERKVRLGGSAPDSR